MATVTVRNVPDDVHRALRLRAAEHGRSTEAEIRDILRAAVLPTERVRLGTAIHRLARKAGLTEADVAVVEQAQDRTPAKPIKLK